MIPTNKMKCCNVEMRHPTMGTVVLIKAEPNDYYNMRKWRFCPFCGKKVRRVGRRKQGASQ